MLLFVEVVFSRNSVLVFILLWMAAGDCAWAASDEPEDGQEAQPAGWLAKVAGTAQDVVRGAQEAVAHPVDNGVSAVEASLVEPVDSLLLDAVASTRDAMVVQVDHWLPLAEGVFEVDVAGFVNDAVPEGTGLLVFQVGHEHAGFAASKGDGLDAVVSTVATVCKDYVLVPVDAAQSLVGSSYGHATADLAPIGSVMAGFRDRARTSIGQADAESRIEELASEVQTLSREAIASTGIVEWAATNAAGAGSQVHHVRDATGLTTWEDRIVPGVALGTIAGAGTGLVSAAEVAANTWEALSTETKQKFRQRGLRTGMKVRADDMAEALYRTVPQSVRASGEAAVLEFLGKYDLSHVKPVSEAPGLAYDLDNVIWEEKALNRKRGSNIMDAAAIQAAREALSLEELKARRKLVASSARRALSRGWIGSMSLEAPVVTLENLLHVHHDRMSPEEAVADGVVDIATTVIVGGAVSGAMSLAGQALTTNAVPIAMAVAPKALAATPEVLAAAPTVLAVWPVVSAVLPVVSVAGLVLYSGHTVYRLCEAAQPEPPDSLLTDDPATQ